MPMARLSPRGLLRAGAIALIVLVGPWALVAVVPGVLVFASVAGCLLPQPDEFDPGAWQRAGGDEVCTARDEMADDLRANHLHAGMTRAEIMTLLGPSEGDDWWGQGTMSWSIGCWIDCTWVVVELDEADRMTGSHLAQD